MQLKQLKQENLKMKQETIYRYIFSQLDERNQITKKSDFSKSNTDLRPETIPNNDDVKKEGDFMQQKKLSVSEQLKQKKEQLKQQDKIESDKKKQQKEIQYQDRLRDEKEVKKQKYQEKLDEIQQQELKKQQLKIQMLKDEEDRLKEQAQLNLKQEAAKQEAEQLRIRREEVQNKVNESRRIKEELAKQRDMKQTVEGQKQIQNSIEDEEQQLRRNQKTQQETKIIYEEQIEEEVQGKATEQDREQKEKKRLIEQEQLHILQIQQERKRIEQEQYYKSTRQDEDKYREKIKAKAEQKKKEEQVKQAQIEKDQGRRFQIKQAIEHQDDLREQAKLQQKQNEEKRNNFIKQEDSARFQKIKEEEERQRKIKTEQLQRQKQLLMENQQENQKDKRNFQSTYFDVKQNSSLRTPHLGQQNQSLSDQSEDKLDEKIILQVSQKENQEVKGSLLNSDEIKLDEIKQEKQKTLKQTAEQQNQQSLLAKQLLTQQPEEKQLEEESEIEDIMVNSNDIKLTNQDNGLQTTGELHTSSNETEQPYEESDENDELQLGQEQKDQSSIDLDDFTGESPLGLKKQSTVNTSENKIHKLNSEEDIVNSHLQKMTKSNRQEDQQNKVRQSQEEDILQKNVKRRNQDLLQEFGTIQQPNTEQHNIQRKNQPDEGSEEELDENREFDLDQEEDNQIQIESMTSEQIQESRQLKQNDELHQILVDSNDLQLDSDVVNELNNEQPRQSLQQGEVHEQNQEENQQIQQITVHSDDIHNNHLENYSTNDRLQKIDNVETASIELEKYPAILQHLEESDQNEIVDLSYDRIDEVLVESNDLQLDSEFIDDEPRVDQPNEQTLLSKVVEINSDENFESQESLVQSHLNKSINLENEQRTEQLREKSKQSTVLQSNQVKTEIQESLLNLKNVQLTMKDIQTEEESMTEQPWEQSHVNKGQQKNEEIIEASVQKSYLQFSSYLDDLNEPKYHLLENKLLQLNSVVNEGNGQSLVHSDDNQLNSHFHSDNDQTTSKESQGKNQQDSKAFQYMKEEKVETKSNLESSDGIQLTGSDVLETIGKVEPMTGQPRQQKQDNKVLETNKKQNEDVNENYGNSKNIELNSRIELEDEPITIQSEYQQSQYKKNIQQSQEENTSIKINRMENENKNESTDQLVAYSNGNDQLEVTNQENEENDQIFGDSIDGSLENEESIESQGENSSVQTLYIELKNIQTTEEPEEQSQINQVLNFNSEEEKDESLPDQLIQSQEQAIQSNEIGQTEVDVQQHQSIETDQRSLQLYIEKLEEQNESFSYQDHHNQPKNQEQENQNLRLEQMNQQQSFVPNNIKMPDFEIELVSIQEQLNQQKNQLNLQEGNLNLQIQQEAAELYKQLQSYISYQQVCKFIKQINLLA